MLTLAAQLTAILLAGDVDKLPKGLRTRDGIEAFVSQLKSESDTAGAYMQEIVLAAEGEGDDEKTYKAPEWIPLLPDSRHVKARDGREWLNTDPDGIIQRFKENGADLPVDREHVSFEWTIRPDDQKAAGWITEMEKRGSYAIWGKVSWTADGRSDVEGRYFRYISPAFNHMCTVVGPDEDEVPDTITRIINAGLVNLPALRMPGLTSQTISAINIATLSSRSSNTPKTAPKPGPTTTRKKTTMDSISLATLIALLGLKADATIEDATQELCSNAAAKRNPGPPDMKVYCLRADYDAVVKAHEESLKIAKAEAAAMHSANVDAAIDAALAANKIAPGSVAYHKSACGTPEGLAGFKAQYGEAAAPVIANADLAARTAPGAGVITLSAHDKEICKKRGIDEEIYLKSKTKIAENNPALKAFHQ